MKPISFYTLISLSLILFSCGNQNKTEISTSDIEMDTIVDVCQVISDAEAAAQRYHTEYYDENDEVNICDYNNEEYDYNASNSTGGNVYLHDDGSGNISGYDSHGNYYNYHYDRSGNMSGYDSRGNYYHSYTDRSGNTSGYDSRGNYYHSYTDRSGNTSGYDSNGNYYHSYTDNSGNTSGYTSGGGYYSVTEY